MRQVEGLAPGLLAAPGPAVSFPAITVYNVPVSGLLLQTKLFKPTPRPALIARPQLIERLHAGLGLGLQGFAARLTLVSAPAGFGKTTLVSTWLAQLAAAGPAPSGAHAAWLSLDEGDNDPVRFLTYLAAALQTVAPHMGEGAIRALQSPEPPPATAVLTLLINDVMRNGQPVILVLDDYHVLTAPPIHQALAFLLDHLPPQLHLLITTRSDPPLPLPRLRSRGQVVEIRADELRFTLDEASCFFDQVMGLTVGPEEMALLETRTEGWIAGLQLAALSLQGQEDHRHFITGFAGSHRLVLDYLTDEVLERRPRGTKNFLLQTSILNRLCGPLCDALTGESQGQAILEQLEQANLFLVALDGERRWYRYHHLFADVLRNRLEQASLLPSNVLPAAPELHRRASAWFEGEGLIDEAIQHALAAADLERAAALVEEYSLLMFQRSQIFTTRAWLERLPADLVKARPRLILAQGWAQVLTGHGQTLETWLAAPATRAAFAGPDLPAEVLGELALLRATQARYEQDHARSLTLALQACELLAGDERGLLAGALYTIAAARLRQGDARTAGEVFAESVLVGETKGGPYMALASLQELAELQMRQGRLSEAVETAQNARRMAGRWGWQSMPATGMAQIYLGYVSYQRNDLTRAHEELSAGLDRLRGSTDQDVLAPGYVTLAQIHMARDDLESAWATIQRGEEWLTQMHVGDRGALTLLSLGKVGLWLRQGQLDTAERRMENGPWWPEDSDLGYRQRLAQVRLRLAQLRRDPHGQIRAAVGDLLGRLLVLKESGGWFGQVIELLLLQALLSQAQGAAERSLDLLERALRLAEPEGYVRLFVDEGEPMAELLRLARLRRLFPDYAERLLAAFPPAQGQTPSSDLLPEPLSERELEVLRLAASGASNKEIAVALFIALPTVKKHMGHILVKLDTQNRVQAIARARELGLLV